jgi:modification methylase
VDILPKLNNIDMVFTSPPYNMGTSPTSGKGKAAFGSWSLGAKEFANGYEGDIDAMPHEEYSAWQTQVLSLCWASLSDTGAIFYNHKPRPMNGVLKLPIDYGVGLPLRQIIIWDRDTGMNFSSHHFLPKHEWIVVWAKSGWRLPDQKVSGIGDVWHISPETKGDHPAPFPIKLPSTAITAVEPKLVLDPFAGSGTTLRAAKNLGVRCIGIEQSERYCELIVARLGQEVLAL